MMNTFFHLGLFGTLGATEIILIVLAIVLLFGAGKIKNLMKELGGGITAFKKGLKEGQEEEKKEPEPSKKDPLNPNPN